MSETTAPTEAQIRSFEALFAADLDSERVPFEVSGRKCWIELKPMDGGDCSRFSSLVRRAQAGEVEESEPALYVLERTLVDWSLWQRPKLASGKRGDWQELRPSENEAQRRAEVRDFALTREFFEWLVTEAMRVNGFTPEQEGN